MGFFDWMMKGIGFDSEEEVDEEALRRKEQLKQEKLARKKMKKYKGRNAATDDFIHEQSASGTRVKTPFVNDPDQFNTSSGYNDFSSGRGDSYSANGLGLSGHSVGGYGTKNVVIFTPKSYEDVQTLIDYLKQGESAIVNLDGIEESEAQRMMDFVSGAVYALNGSVHRITGNIFILTPEGLNIMVPNYAKKSENKPNGYNNGHNPAEGNGFGGGGNGGGINSGYNTGNSFNNPNNYFN